jgi:RNA polymerase sigma-70 factor (ECF subfamily)
MDPDATEVTYASQGPNQSASLGRIGETPHTSPTQEIQLIQRMAAGDENALGELYDRWRNIVFALAARIVGDARDAEEVLEDAFWQAWRQAPRYDASRGTVGTWLLTIARSRALDRVRAQSRRLPVDERLDAESELEPERDSGEPLERADERRIVRVALDELPKEQRQTLELAYFEGLSQSEIAKRTGEPLGTIKTRMRLALRKMRERLSVLRDEGVAR